MHYILFLVALDINTHKFEILAQAEFNNKQSCEAVMNTANIDFRKHGIDKIYHASCWEKGEQK